MYLNQQIDKKFIMIWQEQWELTHSHSLLTPNLEDSSGALCGTERMVLYVMCSHW